MATKQDKQPDFSDEDAVVAWLTEDDLTAEEQQRRATLVEGGVTRRADASVPILNALAAARQGPPSANQ